MDKLKLKNITFYIGAAAVFIAGMLFVLLVDILLKTQSLWLMIAIVLSVGSVVCFVFSDKFREKRNIMYTLIGIAMGLAVAFIVFLVIYMAISMSPEKDLTEASGFVQNFAILRIESSDTPKKDTFYLLLISSITILLSAISVAAQAWNLVLSIKTKDEE